MTDTMVDRNAPRDAANRIVASDMVERGDLISLDTFREELATTEPFVAYSAPVGASWDFDVMENWNVGLSDVSETSRIAATVRIPGETTLVPLTKEALLEATSLCGLPKGYVSRLPADLVKRQLNHWFKGGFGEKNFKLLTIGENDDTTCVAVNKESIVPFSNLAFLDAVEAGIRGRYGSSELYVDYKRNHSLRHTEARIIIPEQSRVITGTGVDDDSWSVGINVANSLTGDNPTQLDGYLFRWWCTNGCIDLNATSGRWSRRGGSQNQDDVMAWARVAVDEVLGGLEGSFDAVQNLVGLDAGEDAVQVLRDVFEQHGVPGPQRNAIIEHMANTERLDMYEIMQAITQAANGDGVPVGQVRTLMEIGGDMPRALAARCDSCRRVLPHQH